MNAADLEKIKTKIEGAKQRKAKAEGQMERIDEQLKKEFECASVEEAEEKLAALQTDIKKDEKRLAELLDEIETAAPWDSL